MLISLDIETSCNVKSCNGYGEYSKCDHALHFKRNAIDVIGAYWKTDKGSERSMVFRDLDRFQEWLKGLPDNTEFLGQNLKFDLKSLYTKIDKDCGQFLIKRYAHDTQCMAVASTEKVSKDWLAEYEEKRIAINKKYKTKHRKAGGYSLKTMAPYFCKVRPFWETDDKDNDEYVIKDCKYTYMLYEYFEKFLKMDGTWDFYTNKLMPWQRFLLDVEKRGFYMDMDKYSEMEINTKKEYEWKLNELKTLWKDVIYKYECEQKQELITEASEKIQLAIEKTRNTKLWAKLNQEKRSAKIDKVVGKQLEILDNKLEKFEGFNFNSPSQMLWLFKELGYPCRDEAGNESVGKDVKEKLILDGKEDIALLDEIDKLQKLISSYIESYKDKVIDNELFATFNISGTRTGRLSSSNPNFQNIPPQIRSLIKPRKGYKFIVRDMSGIEPNLIAFFSEDPTLCNILLNNRNFHNYATKTLIDYVDCDESDVKSKYLKERNLAKQLDLSAFYGTGANGFVRTAKKHRFSWSKQEAFRKLDRYKKTFKQVFKFKKELDKLLEGGETLTGILGRKFCIDDPTEVYMKSLNTLVQGSASDLVVESGCRAQQRWLDEGLDAHVLALVHDEIIAEVKIEDAEKADKILEHEMTKYKLDTVHGSIKLKTDGGISDVWTH